MSEESFDRLHDFDRVDESNTESLIAFLAWVESKPNVLARRRRSYELLGVGPGGRVADVGCGIGTVLVDLLEAGATAIGVDSSEAMVGEAARRAPGAQVHVADAAALPLADGALTGYRAERVFQHLANPMPALAEAMRTLAPGGRIVLVDQDWDAFIVDGDDKQTTRAMLRGFADSIPSGWAGRRNALALSAAGFIDVAVEAETVTWQDYEEAAPFLPAIKAAAVDAGTVAEDVATAWLEEQRRRGEHGRFFAAMTHFLSSGTRP